VCIYKHMLSFLISMSAYFFFFTIQCNAPGWLGAVGCDSLVTSSSSSFTPLLDKDWSSLDSESPLGRSSDDEFDAFTTDIACGGRSSDDEFDAFTPDIACGGTGL